MKTLEEEVKEVIRDIVDFPKPGIVFKDITPIMMNPKISNKILDHLTAYYENQEIDKIAGIESRGFLFGYPLAMRLKKPFILIRKKGKLPYKKVSYTYDLEYGQAEIEIHTDAISNGDKVLIHDDLLATGGSAAAAAHLIQQQGGIIAGFDFLINLDFLHGAQKLELFTKNISNLVHYF